MSLTSLFTWLGPLLEVAALAGLIVRGRLGQAVTLPFLLVALAASATTVGVCPSCNTWDFWLVKEFVHAGLVLVLGLELAQRAFTSAGARRAARRWCAFVVVFMLVLITTTGEGRLMVDVLPRLVACVAWLYTGLGVVMLRYNARIEALHDTILTAYPPYLMVYAATWSQAAESTRLAALANPVLQIGVLGALVYAAWAPPRAMDLPLVRRWLGLETRPRTSRDSSRTLHFVPSARVTS